MIYRFGFFCALGGLKGHEMSFHRKGSFLLIASFASQFLVLQILQCQASFAQEKSRDSLQAKTIEVRGDASDGSYTIFDPASQKPILHAAVAAQIDHRWIKSGDYPEHSVQGSREPDHAGAQDAITINNHGLQGEPDLIYLLGVHSSPDFVTIAVKVRNTSEKALTVQAIRSVEAKGVPVLDLGGNESSYRILSDSFSEDRPGIVIHNLADATDGMHRAVGSQLIYSRDTKRNLFLGTLSSEKFLTVLRLHVAKDHLASYEVDSTGTTELERENSLQDSSPEDQIELSLPLAPGAELSSEPLLISTGTDYLTQLETYGSIIRKLHHPRRVTQTPAGWWSWTAYYFGLDQGTAITNATWLAQNLKDLGYDFFHIDEGYQYARGEYSTPDATLFPGGMQVLERKITALGLTPGIWTAPFEVSERSWVYENHKDWLVHNAAGQPIHAGWVIQRDKGPSLDQLYILDTTNPGAQDYLRKTYSTLTRDWGIRYIKLDFMDDSAIEGYYHKPKTTALEAQRIGLQVIREAVGEKVLLDKDGSVMLNPVGLVDTGRISVDTGHQFAASREAAPGIAARFFMNGNYYLADPDAFTVSKQIVGDQEWHGGAKPLTLDEAKVSIALAAIAGGMYEIGDDLPTLGSDTDRLALIKNQDLLNMTRLGRSSRPLDLMSYKPADEMPSIFLLRESKRQSILTVFNWTEKETRHEFNLNADLDLQVQGHNQVFDVFDSKQIGSSLNSIEVILPPHSTRVFKIIDTSVPAAAPSVKMKIPDKVKTGETIEFSADLDPAVPATAYRWDFGDGTTSKDQNPRHSYTYAGEFTAKLRVDGIDGMPAENSVHIKVSGIIGTRFVPANKKRFSQP
jgi:alpha-galactosidase